MQRCDSSSEAARLEIAAHPHMLRHACGSQLANDGQDTRAIQHTVRYMDLSAHRFKESWKAMLRYAFPASSQDGIFGGLSLQPL